MSITKKVLPLRQVEIASSHKRPQRLVVQLLFIYFCKTTDIVKQNFLIKMQMSLLFSKQKEPAGSLSPELSSIKMFLLPVPKLVYNFIFYMSINGF